MAARRTNVPPALRQQLVDEAGGQCANPGCSSHRTHIHHINEWAIYGTHHGDDMVAICPSCHDAIHHGPLVIDDETIRRWKRIPRSGTPHHDHVYIQPGASSKLLLGTIAVTGGGGVTAFELGRSNRLSFRVEDADIMLVNLAVSTTSGSEVLRVVDGHVRGDVQEPVTYERVPGHIRVSAPATDDFIPTWALQRLRTEDPDFGADGVLCLLDMEVLAPGLIRVQGLWNDPTHIVAITDSYLVFLDPATTVAVELRGEGPDTVFHHMGPITTSLFGLAGTPGALRIPTTED